jgi:hypothetical protein
MGNLQDNNSKDVFQVTKRAELLHDLYEIDISYEKFGEMSSFEPAHELKNDTCEYLMNILRGLELYGSEMDEISASAYGAPFDRITKKLKAQMDRIVSEASQGPHRTGFDNDRDNIINEMRQIKEGAHVQLAPYKNLIDIAELKKNSGSEVVDEARRNYEQAKEAAERANSEIQNILKSLQSDIGDQTAEEAEAQFSSLATGYGIRERNWFIGVVISTLFLVIAVSFALQYQLDPGMEVELIMFEGVKKILLISIAIAAIKVCLSKYNAERHLKIIYDHRAKAIEQFMVFQNSIPKEDFDARGALRLEMARVVFSDPATSYTQSQGGSELNINPIIAAAERTASGKS